MYKNREISNSEDIVDSRDIIKRIEELQDELDDTLQDAEDSVYESTDVPGKWGFTGCDSDSYDTQDEAIKAAKEYAQTSWDESEEGEELKALKALADECEGYGDWEYGEALIRDSYMDEDWARQEMEDLGYISKDLPSLIADNINWRGVLEDLQQDYTEVEWDGVTYWMRS